MCTVKEWKKVDASLITFLQFVVGGILEVEMPKIFLKFFN